MTKEQFKIRWESNDAGDGITLEEVAECAKSWGLVSKPYCCPIDYVLSKVLEAAQCE